MTLVIDLVRALREPEYRDEISEDLETDMTDYVRLEAADHMESLEARLEMAREALREIAETPSMGRGAMQNHARRTLAALDEDRRTGE